MRARKTKCAWISRAEFEALFDQAHIDTTLVGLYLTILTELGYVIHYANDPLLQDMIILRPEWLSKAISFVLESDAVKVANGLVRHDQLAAVWNDPNRPAADRYDAALYPVFLTLMNKFDITYRVALPDGAPDTSLVAQLVPGVRPDDWQQDWPDRPATDDRERTQYCRVVDGQTGRTTDAPGLMYSLIVRLHRYSLGRADYHNSRHWSAGMIVEDRYNGRALIENINDDIRVTVRGAYPERFLHLLCGEINYLVEDFWRGLKCHVSVPCHSPCKSVHSVEHLMRNKRHGTDKILCATCDDFHTIDFLLGTPAPTPGFAEDLKDIKAAINKNHREVTAQLRASMSRADAQFDGLMKAMTDPAKDGPRLFSLEAVEPGFWDQPDWISTTFRLTLWCEHTRTPLPLLSDDDTRGVYELTITKDWFNKAAPYLGFLSSTLSLVLPIAAPAVKLVMDGAGYKAIENQLNFGLKCAETMLKGTEKLSGSDRTRLMSDDNDAAIRADDGNAAIRADGAVLRDLHGLLKDKDPRSSFGGLSRVQNKQRQFLWVHEDYVAEY